MDLIVDYFFVSVNSGDDLPDWLLQAITCYPSLEGEVLGAKAGSAPEPGAVVFVEIVETDEVDPTPLGPGLGDTLFNKVKELRFISLSG